MTALRLHSAAGRWVVAGSVLGSGAVFLESGVVNVALPAMARDFHVGVVGLQWVINGYLLTLSALMLLGGALGDRFGRARVFPIGCVAFAIASRDARSHPGWSRSWRCEWCRERPARCWCPTASRCSTWRSRARSAARRSGSGRRGPPCRRQRDRSRADGSSTRSRGAGCSRR